MQEISAAVEAILDDPEQESEGKLLGQCPDREVIWQPQVRAFSRFRFNTLDMAQRENPEYITFYNVNRSHSSLGYVSPEFERQKRIKVA